MINSVLADKYPVIKEILENPNERRTIEFKPSLLWPKQIDNSKLGKKIQEIIRSILGLSNLRNGGRTILGVEKDSSTGNYTAKGMKKKHLPSYDQDNIYQAVRNFGSPEPRFETLNVEFNSNYFIVFEVQTFHTTPVVCVNRRNNLKKLDNSAIYIRNDKPETVKVTQPDEMHEVINITVDKQLSLFSSRIGTLFKSMSKIHIARDTDEVKFKEQRGSL